MSKMLSINAQIMASEYTKADGTTAVGYTLSLLLPGRTVLVKPCNNKNYGAIRDLAENNPESVFKVANK